MRVLENIGFRNEKQEEKRSFNNLTRNKTRRQGVFFSEGLTLVVRTGRNSFFDSFFYFQQYKFSIYYVLKVRALIKLVLLTFVLFCLTLTFLTLSLTRLSL